MGKVVFLLGKIMKAAVLLGNQSIPIVLRRGRLELALRLGIKVIQAPLHQIRGRGKNIRALPGKALLELTLQKIPVCTIINMKRAPPGITKFRLQRQRVRPIEVFIEVFDQPRRPTGTKGMASSLPHPACKLEINTLVKVVLTL